MRMTVHFDRPQGLSELCIPMHYNYLVQSMLYSMMDDTLSKLYHDSGFALNGRKYKLFTFSRFLFREKYSIKKCNGLPYLCTKGIVYLKISAVDYRILESLASKFMKVPYVHIGRVRLLPVSVEVEKTPSFRSPATIRMLSPLTVYSTANGYRTFHKPGSQRFAELVLFNLIRKHKIARKLVGNKYEMSAKEWEELYGCKTVIEPVRVTQKHKKIIPVIKKGPNTGTVIGWMGTYRLNMPAALIQLAYDAGIGARNPIGFGMIELEQGE